MPRVPEPFKTFFNREVIAAIGDRLADLDPGFDRPGFVAMAGDGLEALELKARSAQIARALDAHLPADFARACALLVGALHPDDDAPLDALATPDARGLRGWAVMPMADVVAARGSADPDRAMATLGEMTKRFSAEFAVRPLIAADPHRGMAWMRRWAGDPNLHLRRLASEGCRPRLPWGMRLRAFVADPSPVIEVLELLKDDPEEYVRRSVANNLNDVAKDHPDRAAAIGARWLEGASPARRRLVRHAMRGLVKAGHPGALAALGHAPAPVRLVALEIATPAVRFGDALEFAATLTLDGAAPREIALDYVIHHRKANGTLGPKVFKWRVFSLPPGAPVRLARRHRMRPITTRRYFDGAHRLELVANGASLGAVDFVLSGACAPPPRRGQVVDP
jgi:3-methyladenine DNA glycosylase AlkC